MPIISNYDDLTPLEIIATQHAIGKEPVADGEARPTVVEYLEALKAGQAALDSYIEQYITDGLESLRDVADPMLRAGVSTEWIILMCQFAAQSTPTVLNDVLEYFRSKVSQ